MNMATKITFKVSAGDVINALSRDGISISEYEASSILCKLDLNAVEKAAEEGVEQSEKIDYAYNEVCAQYWKIMG